MGKNLVYLGQTCFQVVCILELEPDCQVVGDDRHHVGLLLGDAEDMKVTCIEVPAILIFKAAVLQGRSVLF